MKTRHPKIGHGKNRPFCVWFSNANNQAIRNFNTGTKNGPVFGYYSKTENSMTRHIEKPFWI